MSDISDYDILVKDVPYTDHEHMGNVCSGFGGSVECKYVDYETGKRCRLSPYRHRYRKPGIHMGEYDKAADLALARADKQAGKRLYKGRHAA